jgi:hypothetical protein
VTCQVFLSAKAQQDLDAFPDKIAHQILADCARLARDPIPDGKANQEITGVQGEPVPIESRRLSRRVQTVQPA